MNARLSQETNPLINAMQTRVIRATSLSTNDRVLPRTQNISCSLPSHQNGTGTGLSSDEPDSVVFANTRIQILQRKTQGPCVISNLVTEDNNSHQPIPDFLTRRCHSQPI